MPRQTDQRRRPQTGSGGRRKRPLHLPPAFLGTGRCAQNCALMPARLCTYAQGGPLSVPRMQRERRGETVVVCPHLPHGQRPRLDAQLGICYIRIGLAGAGGAWLQFGRALWPRVRDRSTASIGVSRWATCHP